MLVDHTGRTALVTGAARGIGLEMASALASSGADVLLPDVLDDIEKVAREIRDRQDMRARALQVDITNYKTVETAVGDAATQLDIADVLTNNAAITTNAGELREMNVDAYRRDLTVNLTSAFNCNRVCIGDMVEAGFGRVVNVSSLAREIGGFGQAGYASSKAGLLGLIKRTALEYAPVDVTANAVVPGVIKLPASETIRENMLERIVDAIPTGERGDPSDIAAAVDFLASEQASYINGTELNIDADQRLFIF